MIQVFCARRGSGKTKRLIELANHQQISAKGDAVYIDDDSRPMLQLARGIRFIDTNEYKVDDCKDIRHLRFDFYLPERNVCIEYDGEQHFAPVKYGSSIKRGTPEERYKETKRRDNIKSDFCKKNNIDLIRIPYMDFNKISEIINKHFS